MKNKEYKKGKMFGIGGVLLVCVGIVVAGSLLNRDSETIVVDKDERVIAHLLWGNGKIQYECESGNEDYIDLTCREAIDVLKEKEKLSEKQAQKELAKGNYIIKSFYDQDVFQALKAGSSQMSISVDEAKVMAISDGEGKLLAAYTESRDSEVNQLLRRTYSGSTIKPLSTYGPGIEENVIYWSKLYEDSPYTESWPTNVESFTGEGKTVAQALQESNNAITVKILDDVGLENACTYLRETLGMTVNDEEEMIQEDEEKYKTELLGSLGLGYLNKGVTIKEMLEDYQAFGKGGVRYQLSVMESLTDENGTCIYRKKEKKDRIFSEDTAYIVNRMLRGVVENGTAKSAQIDGIDVCGKTGTSQGYRDNWFIGMTPEYVCAAWYSQNAKERIQNEAILAFKSAFQELALDKEKEYPRTDKVEEKEYCKKTGLLAGEHCSEVQTGYYKKDALPETCNE